MTIQEINQKIQDIQTALSANPEGRAKELLKQGLQTFQSLLLAEQKKKRKPTNRKNRTLADKNRNAKLGKKRTARNKLRPRRIK